MSACYFSMCYNFLKYMNCALQLQHGKVHSGQHFGAPVAASGELVFMTGQTGYPQVLTDPSFAGQILVLTYPLIGNYGVPKEGLESSAVQVAGLVVSEHCTAPSHHLCTTTLHTWLMKNGVPAISSVDTRALTQHLAEKGSTLARLTPQGIAPKPWYDPAAEHMVSKVSPKKPVFHKRGKKVVALLDCGMKQNILRCFLRRGVSVWQLPHDHTLEGISYDGLFISNGPGDPTRATETIATVKKAIKGNKPIFGICLGNQILALAAGAKTHKMRFGNRGQNQPVKDLATGRAFVTSQNHGYAVDERTLPPSWKPAFRNINDGSNEGIAHVRKPFFSVQFHPEAAAGPEDAEYLFDTFIATL